MHSFIQITVAASKDYTHKHKLFFSPIYATTGRLSYNVSNINFAAARVQINITADVQGATKAAPPYNIYVQPKGKHTFLIWQQKIVDDLKLRHKSSDRIS